MDKNVESIELAIVFKVQNKLSESKLKTSIITLFVVFTKFS